MTSKSTSSMQRLGRVMRGGFTMIELLVSVAVLSILMLAFGMIVSGSRRLVSTSEGLMRANSTAEAIATAFRTEIRRASQNGFICIQTPNAVGADSALFACTAGPSTSMTEESSSGNPLSASGAVTAYGTCLNDGQGGNILWRSSWLLHYNPPTADVATSDYWKSDLADMQTANRAAIDGMVNTLITTVAAGKKVYIPDKLKSPPDSLDDVKLLWKYMAVGCYSRVPNEPAFKVSWTDGTTTAAGNLQWYDKDNPKDGAWGGKTVTTGAIEYSATVASVPPVTYYRALWTHENQSNWPVAIKIRFTLNDPALPTEFSSLDYEVICPIGR